MKKTLFSAVLLLLAVVGYAQLNNSWIDYSKTYYKFRLANDTLCRINQSALPAAIAGTPAQNFQLWRNGQEVRLYTSVATGPLAASDYIEFWGLMNDGKPDKGLYRNADYQLSGKYSLETDTATYYLTVNPVGNNLRYVQSPNNIAGNVLPAETYFMRRVEANYKSQINKGYAAVIGEYVYSSSYDIGEGWTSNEIFPCCALSKVFSNLNVYTAGPPNSVMFTIGAVGNALYSRELVAKFYNNVVYQIPMPFFNYRKDTVRNLPLSLLASPTDLPVSVNGNSSDANDRIVVSCISVTYPATFNFNNEKNFYFELKANPAGNYLVINNFNSNGIAPVLYDYNNAKRYLGDIAIPGQVRFVLPASTDSLRKFNLMSQDASNISIVNNLTTKTFTNYSIAANQGNYLIISNPVLYNDGSGVNNVDLYRQYRSSVTGGGFNAKTYDINELTDQFGFGIKKHPSAIRDFISYAYNSFAATPKYAFIIGRAVSYEDYTILQSNPIADQLNLVQTFGYPASDILLSAAPGTYVPLIPIGRLGAVNGSEVGNYYRKMLEYEAAQQSTSQTIADKAWMKNYLHTIGGSDSLETADFTNYMNTYKLIAEDSLMGAHVETYAKSTVAAIDQQQSARIEELFHIGLTYVKYFGHSSSNELSINLNYPENYQNAGKYPFVHISGCTVGNYYTYNPSRLTGYIGMSLSEKYTFLNQKGGIGFLGSTHFGIAPFLHVLNTSIYHNICRDMYGNTIGNQLKNTLQAIGGNPALLDFYTRIHLEEVNLQGDPALKINSFAKPDYVIEDQLVKFTPNIISVADASFNVNVKMMNIGRSIKDSMRVIIKQQLPAGTIKILYNQMVPATINTDSVSLNVPINPITDKGLNKLFVSLDDGNRIDELSETNNTLTKDFYIFEDELNPVSPYNYSIVGQQNINFYASTANALSSTRQYVMEIDTTELFNSSFKKTYNASGTGGVIQFAPTNLTFSDSTVYYWRTSIVPTGSSPTIWNTFSFVYLAGGTTGFNQSHYFQHLKSSYTNIIFAADRKWKFNQYQSYVKIKNGVFPTAARDAQDFAVIVDGSNDIQSVCGISNVIFNVFSPFDMLPWQNNYPGTGLYGSDDVCGPDRKFNFQYNIMTPAKRAAAVAFLDMVPVGYYVTVRNTSYTVTSTNTYANDWKLDDPINHNTLYDRLKNAGFTEVDSFNRPRAFNFIYKKQDNSFVPLYKFSDDIYDKVILDAVCPVTKGNGTITSPVFGPARAWSQFHWRGSSSETTAGDSISFNIIGINPAGGETTLYTVDSTTKDLNISSIDPVQYPYLKLKMYNQDKVLGTPYQLRYWRLNYTPIPEGAVSPNILFNMKDTVDQGEPINFKLAFKNISPTAFDSTMKINITITDKDNQIHVLPVPRGKKLIAGDTLVVSYTLDTKLLPGNNTLFVDVNPNNDQVEQFHFNNVLYKDFFVRADTYNPLLDITFDGVHILNKDIVAAKPRIVARLKDESRFLALADTALIKVQVRFPDGSLHNYRFGDTMHFTPANLAAGENAATIDLTPTFTQDGEYELIVTGKDVVGNKAGALDYHVIFTVISKAMISNLLNYPNPFTSSTAFVFTITGNEVPQNIRIQVLTITGKVVREITKDELGPLHVGRNITEFKWDGTDMYGAKLANGVYLYRVLTNLNGKSLEKYKADGDNTDKFFNKGYGKMVILR
ncbi:MAG: C25 family cysteine peptidase [Sphingobacteriales bacterium]|nr:C25 family cysteine peptidase [Sphingobacteriales bacterium]